MFNVPMYIVFNNSYHAAGQKNMHGAGSAFTKRKPNAIRFIRKLFTHASTNNLQYGTYYTGRHYLLHRLNVGTRCQAI
jgi:hypothetical protein